MIPRSAKVEIVALLLYCVILMRMDKRDGFRTAAQLCRWYGAMCRETATWFWVQGIRADNAARELVEP